MRRVDDVSQVVRETVSAATASATTITSNALACDTDCRECGGVGWVRYDVPVGDPMFGRMRRCSRAAELDMQRYPQRTGLQRDEQALDWDAILRPSPLAGVVERLSEMVQQRAGFVLLHGRPGTGKSMTLKIAVATAARLGMTARYSSLTDMLDDIRQAYDTSGEAMGELTARSQRWAGLDVLGLDELDKPSYTPWVTERMFWVLDARYRAALDGRACTFVAANDPSRIGEYLMSRFGDYRVGLTLDLKQAVDRRRR